MVEIFKTNITDISKGNIIIRKLLRRFPSYRINFDLDDCDNILRIESYNGIIDIESIIEIVKQESVEIDLITG